jgi:hypothetical protein
VIVTAGVGDRIVHMNSACVLASPKANTSAV